MSNKLYLFIFSVFMYFAANSQSAIKVVWGAYHPMNSNHEEMFFLGNGFNNDSSSYLFYVDNNVERYNKKLDLIKVISAKKSMGGNSFLTSVRDTDRLYLFSYSNKGIILKHKFDTTTYRIQEGQQISEMQVSDKIQTKFSPDSSCLLLFSFVEEKKGSTIDICVISRTGKLLWKTDIPINNKSIRNIPSINNAGEVFFVDYQEESKIVVYLLSKKNPSGIEVSLKSKGKKLLQPVSCSNNLKWYLALPYNMENLQYDCLYKTEIIEFSQMGKILKTKLIEESDCLKSATPIYMKSIDKHIYIAFEEFSTKQNQSNNQIAYGSLFITYLQISDFAKLWQTEIFKNHYYVTEPYILASSDSREYTLMHGHKSILHDAKLYFIFNDNCKNTSINSTGPKSHSAIDRSCVNVVSIQLATGAVDRHINPGLNNEKYCLYVNNTSRVSENQVLLFAKNAQYRLGKLYLK